MLELGEQMYCSEQIQIPPQFPYLLRQYAKAAIRTQPTDLLRWSTAYFRCLSLDIPPPVKPRLEYPIPRSYAGITPGWLKALLYQLQNNQTVPFKILWDRWIGACLEHKTLIQILCLGGFKDPYAIPWLRFVALCAAFLTDDLTHTMILICEIITEEPEGGSAMISLETFLDIYKFLAAINASCPQRLKNLYFTDSLLSLLKDEGIEQPKEEEVEAVAEEESEKSEASEKTIEVLGEKLPSKETISCPSIAGDDVLQYSMDYFMDMPAGEDEDQDMQISGFLGDDHVEVDEEVEGVVSEEKAEAPVEEEEKAEGAEEELIGGEAAGEEAQVEEALEEAQEEEIEGVAEEEKEIEDALDFIESVDTLFEEPRKIEPELPLFDDQEALQEDLERLKQLQEIPGETDEELEKYKCELIADMPVTDSLLQAITHFKEGAALGEVRSSTDRELKALLEEGEEAKTEGEEEEEEDESRFEWVWVDAVPGIGPTVPEHLVSAVCEYMHAVSKVQHGMVMPRNIRHYNCPPLEVLEY